MIEKFCLWLSATPLSLLVQTTTWIIPVTQSIHILCIAVVMASMSMLDLRLLGLVGRRQSIPVMADRYLPWLWGSVVVLALTGLILVIGEPARELLNPMFRLKMLLLLAGLVMSAAFRYALHHDVSRWEAVGSATAARVLGLSSLAVWVGIIICGRWIAYTQ